MSTCLNKNDIEIKQLTQQINERRDISSPLPEAVVAAKVNSIIQSKRKSQLKFYEGDITPSENTIFVFGSNPIGINGNKIKGTGGAALVATKQFGVGQREVMDNTLSKSGKAYGLVTVRAPGKRKSVSKEQIINNISKLYEVAISMPDKEFKVAYRNTNEVSLNGYTGLEMIDMFNQAGDIPSNVIFSKEWNDTKLLNNQPEISIPTVDELEEYLESISFEDRVIMSEKINQLRNLKDKVYLDYPDPFIRKQRVSMLVRMFKDMLDILQEEYPTSTRIQIINTLSPRVIYGKVKDMLVEYANISDEETAEEFNKLINNFDALISLGAPQILLIEGLKLDSTKAAKTDMTSEGEDGTYNSDNEDGDQYTIEERVLDGWQFNFREVSASDSMSQEVRAMLADIAELDFKGEPLTVDFGTQKFPVFLDPDYAHNAFMERLRFMTSITDMDKLLNEMVRYKPWVNEVIEKIQESATLRTKFYVDFRKDFVLYSIQRANLSGRDGRYNYRTVEINHPQGIGFLLEEWKDNYQNGRMLTNNSIFDKNGYLRFKAVDDNLSTLLGLKQKFSKLSWPTRKDVEGIAYSNSLVEEFLTQHIKQLNDLTKSVGINFTDELLEQALSIKPLGINGSELESKGNVDTLLNNLQTIFEGLTKETNWINIDQETGEKVQATREDNVRIEFENLFKKPYIAFGNLFKPIVDDAIEASIYENGKSYYSHVNPSFLGKLIKTLKNEANLKSKEEMEKFYQKEFKDSFWFFKDGEYRNEWLKELTADTQSGTAARQLLQHKVLLHFDRVNYSEMDDLQYSLALVNEYFSDPNEDIAWYHIPVLSDAPSGEFLKFKRYSKDYINDDGDNVKIYEDYTLPEGEKIPYNSFIIEKFIDIALQEFDRIKITEERKKLIDAGQTNAILNLDKNGDKFHFFPILNESIEDIKYLMSNNMEIEAIDLIKEKLISYTEEKFQNFLKEKQEQGVLETLPESVTLKFLNIKDGSSLQQSNGKYFGTVVPKLRDYFWNSMFATTQIIQLTNVDLAQFKNIEDFYKRNKQIHAPSTRLDTTAVFNDEVVGREEERTLYIQDNEESSLFEYRRDLNEVLLKREKVGDISTAERLTILSKYGQYNTKSFIITNDKGKKFRYIHYIDNEGNEGGFSVYDIKNKKYTKIDNNRYQTALKSTKSKEIEGLQDLTITDKFVVYTTNKVNQTDGQSYRTLSSYRRLNIMAAEWSNEQEEAYKKIQNNEWSMADYNIIFQPKKTYLYTHATVDTKVTLGNSQNTEKYKLGIQHKHAEVVLLPLGIIKDSGKFSGLMRFMNENDHDRISFNSVVKVGEQGTININDLNNASEVYNYLNAVTKINGIDNPEIIHSTSFEDYGIQQKVPEHGIDAVSLYGTQIRKLIAADLPTDMKITTNGVTRTKKEWINHYKSLITENIIESFQQVQDIFSSKEELSKILQEEVKGNKRYGPDVLTAIELDADGNFNIPLLEPSQATRIQQLLNAIIKNRITKQKINGGSIVNMSNYGFTDDLQIKINPNTGAIEYMECYMPITSAKFIKPLLEADGTININKKDAKGNFIYPEELRKLVGYRIPTENKYSMFPIRIKGFLPQTMGGVIMLPAEITTIAGLDFDVDKLYIMMPNSQVVGNKISKVTYKTTADFDSYKEYVYNNAKSEEATLFKGDIKEKKKEAIQRLKQSKVEYMEELSLQHKQEVQDFKDELKGSDLIYQIVELNSKRRDALMELSEDIRYKFSELKRYLFENKVSGAPKVVETLNLTLELLNEQGLSQEDTEVLKYLASIHELELQAYGLKEKAIKDFFSNAKQNLTKGIQAFYDEKQTILDSLMQEAVTKLADAQGLLTYEDFKKQFKTNPEQYNSKEARDNELIDLTWSILTSPEMAHKMSKPGGFEVAKVNSRIITILQNASPELLEEARNEGFNDLLDFLQSKSLDELNGYMDKYKPVLDVLTPDTQVKIHSQYGAASRMISIAATNNANHALLQHTNLTLNEIKDETGKITLSFAFTLDGKRYRLLNKIKSGEEVNTKGNLVETNEGDYITDNNSEILGASVDAVKDPVLNYLNANPTTSPILFLLNRLGYDPLVTALLLNQPVVLDITKDSIVGKRQGIRMQEITDKYREELLMDLRIHPKDSTYLQFNFSKQDLSNMIVLGNKVKQKQADEFEVREFYEYQAKVAGLISHILDSAIPLQDETNAVRADTPKGGAGPTTGHTLMKIKAIEDYINLVNKVPPPGKKPTKRNSSPFLNGDFISLDYNTDIDSFREKYKGSPMYEIQSFITFGLLSNKKLFSPYVPYYNEIFSSVRSKLESYAKNNKLNPKVIDTIHNDLYVYIMNNSKFLGGKTQKEEDSLSYFANKYPNKYEEIIKKFANHPDIVSNQFIRSLSVLTPTEETPFKRLRFKEVGKLKAFRRETVMQDWNTLLYSEEPELNQLALDLFKYATVRNGFAFGPHSFIHLASVEIKKAIPGYIEELNKTINMELKDFNSANIPNIDYFALQFILNHPELKIFFHQVTNNKIFLDQIEGANVPKKSLTIKAKEGQKIPEEYKDLLNAKGELQELVVMKFAGKDYLYMWSQSEEDSITYTQQEWLGFKHEFIQYQYGVNPMVMTNWLEAIPVPKKGKGKGFVGYSDASGIDYTTMQENIGLDNEFEGISQLITGNTKVEVDFDLNSIFGEANDAINSGIPSLDLIPPFEKDIKNFSSDVKDDSGENICKRS